MARSDDGRQRGKTAAREGLRCHPMVTRHGQKRQLEGGDDDDLGKSKRPSGSSASEAGDDAPTCWICLGEGPNASGEPLRRDCSCRGASGYAHVSCIDEWARRKAEDWDGDDDYPYDLQEPWIECNQCRQYYQDEMAVDMAEKLVAFVGKNHRDNVLLYLESLSLQLNVLSEQTLISSRYPKILQGKPDAGRREEEQNLREEVKQKADNVLSIIGRLKERSASLSDEVLEVESNACFLLGTYFHSKLTKEDARRAVTYYEKSLAMNLALEEEECVANAEGNIAMAKSVYEGTRKWADELVKKRRKAYDLSVADNDTMVADTMQAGIELAVSLHSGNRMIEAERLSSKLVRTCNQVHGPDNCITKEAERILQLCKERYVTIPSRSGPQTRYRALRYEKNGTKCVVRGPVRVPRYNLAIRPFLGPIAADAEISNAKTFTVDSTAIRPTLGTPVVCYGLRLKDSHLNGKIGDLQSRDEQSGRFNHEKLFNIHFEDPNIDPKLVDHRFMRILFDVPHE